MDYLQFNTEDFINDPRFRNFVLQSNDKDYAFWSDFISRHPEKSEDIQQAKAFLEFFYDKLPDTDLKYEFEKFEAIIQATKSTQTEIHANKKAAGYSWYSIAAAIIILCCASVVLILWLLPS